MAARNARVTIDAIRQKWSSTSAAAATAATVSAASRLSADNSTISAAAADQDDTSMDAEVAGQLVGIVFAVAGVILNVAAFTAVYRTRMRNRALRLGLLSLACSDLLLALSTVGLLGLEQHGLYAQHLALREFGAERSESCAVEVCRWMWAASTDAEMFTLALLAVQQFVAVRWPLRTADGMSSRSSAYALAVLWLVSALLGLAPAVAVAASTEHHPLTGNWTRKGTTRFCYQLVIYNHRNITTSRYTFDLGQQEFNLSLLGLDLGKICAVLAALAVSYGYVAHTIRHPCPGDSCGSTAAGLVASSSRRQDRKRVMLVTATVTLLCLCSYLPLFIQNTLSQLGCTKCYRLIDSVILRAVGALSSVADPLVYTLRLKPVRQMALSPLSRLRRCLRKSDEEHSVKHSGGDMRTQHTTTRLEFGRQV